MKGLRVIYLFAIALLMTGCASGVKLIPDDQRIMATSVEKPKEFRTIPLKIAVYLSPQTLKDKAFSISGFGSVIDYGNIAPRLGEELAVILPKTFSKVYVLNDFPSSKLTKTEVEAVLVIESAASSLYGSLAGMWVDTVINFGIYSRDGQIINRYRVGITSNPPRKLQPTQSEMYQMLKEYLLENFRLVIYQAINRFPMETVKEHLVQNKNQIEKNLNEHEKDESYWIREQAEFLRVVEAGKIPVPTPTITVEQQLQRDQLIASSIGFGASALRGGMMGSNQSLNSAGLNQQALLQILQQKALDAMLRTNNGGGEISFLELIGGRDYDKLNLIKALVNSATK